MVEVEETGKVKRVEVQDESNRAMIEFENADSVRTMLKLERNNQSSFNAMVNVCTIARFMERQGGIPGPTILVRYDSDDKEVDEIHLL